MGVVLSMINVREFVEVVDIVGDLGGVFSVCELFGFVVGLVGGVFIVSVLIRLFNKLL